jgi:hypothetical protein
MLLDYALLTAPTPLQAGGSAALTLVISNGGRQIVTVKSIVITLPIGTNAKDLTASTGFQSATSTGWNIAQNGGALTLTPTGGGVVTADPVVVTIVNVAVNAQPGTTNLFIDETAVQGGASQTTSTSLPVAKFPAQFALSDLVVTPTVVAYGGAASVMWTGTKAEAATYTLDWQDAPTHPVPVTNVGPYPATNLTIFPAVFTLTVSLTVPGQDQKVTVQRQATVTETPSVSITRFASSRLTVGPGQTFDLSWEVQLATSLVLGLPNAPGTGVSVIGLTGCTVAEQNGILLLTDATNKQIGTLAPSPFPSQLSFQLTAGDGNTFVHSSTWVDVLPPVIDVYTYSIQVSPHRIAVNLTWATHDARAVAIEGLSTSRPLPTSGNLPMTFGSSVQFTFGTLIATGYGGLTATRYPTKIG